MKRENACLKRSGGGTDYGDATTGVYDVVRGAGGVCGNAGRLAAGGIGDAGVDVVLVKSCHGGSGVVSVSVGRFVSGEDRMRAGGNECVRWRDLGAGGGKW